MKKNIVLAMTTAAVIAALTGCGSSKTTETPPRRGRRKAPQRQLRQQQPTRQQRLNQRKQIRQRQQPQRKVP